MSHRCSRLNGDHAWLQEEGAAQITEAAGFAAVGDGGAGLKRAGVLIAVEAVREVYPASEVAIGIRDPRWSELAVTDLAFHRRLDG